MESYLNDYCKFISSCKKYPSISDTEEFISSSTFDVNEVLIRFEKHINIQNIFNLIESKSFYSGHKKEEKFLLLIQFFNILHTYSKNLIINYDLYSSKSIQETNANIKDCMVHIPDYMGYLSNLIGYCYSTTKREWSITTEFNSGTKLSLAAVCILTSHAHQILTAMKNETDFSKDSDESRSEPNKENQDPTTTKWSCDVCSFTNNASDFNCTACFSPNKTPADKPDKMPTSFKHSESNQWQCESCSFVNDEANQICDVCQYRPMLFKSLDCDRKVNKLNMAGKNLSKSVTSDPRYAKLDWSDVDVKPHQPRNTKASRLTKGKQITNSKVGDYASVTEISKSSNNQWACDKCTFLNDERDSMCKACLSGKINSADKRMEPSLNPKSNQEEHFTENEGHWKCRKCLSFNKRTLNTCDNCGYAKPTNIPDNKNPKTPINTEIASKNEIHPKELIKRTNKSLTQIERGQQNKSEDPLSHPVKQSIQVIVHSSSQKGQWECDECKVMNNERDSVCKSCPNGKRNSVDTNVNESTKRILIPNNTQEEISSRNQSKWNCKQCSSLNSPANNACNVCKVARKKTVLDEKNSKIPTSIVASKTNQIRQNESNKSSNKPQTQEKRIPQKNSENKMPPIVKHSQKYTVSNQETRVNDENIPGRKTNDKVNKNRGYNPIRKWFSFLICGANRRKNS